MQPKTINKILTAKHKAWCASIDNETVRSIVEKNTIITGGCIVSLLSQEEPNDYDVYLRTPEAAMAVAQYYVDKLKANPPKAFEEVKDHVNVVMEPAIPEGSESMRASGRVKGPQPPRVRIVVGKTERGLRGEEMVANDLQYAEGQLLDDTEPVEGASYEDNAAALDEQPAAKLTDKTDAKKRGKYRVLFVTANAITLSDGIQIVLRFNGEINQIHENYDFVHCCNAWASWLPEDERLILRLDSVLAIMSKQLTYQGSKYPIASVIRTRKFLKRGWSINAGQYVKMAFQIGDLDLTDPAVLEDQLVGVDSAYFSMLIAKLREMPDPEKIDGAYVITLIDKVFG